MAKMCGKFSYGKFCSAVVPGVPFPRGSSAPDSAAAGSMVASGTAALENSSGLKQETMWNLSLNVGWVSPLRFESGFCTEIELEFVRELLRGLERDLERDAGQIGGVPWGVRV